MDYLINNYNLTKYIIKVYQKSPTALTKFREEIAENCSLSIIELSANLNENYNILNDNISSALHKHLPVKTFKFQKT